MSVAAGASIASAATRVEVRFVPAISEGSVIAEEATNTSATFPTSLGVTLVPARQEVKRSD